MAAQERIFCRLLIVLLVIASGCGSDEPTPTDITDGPWFVNEASTTDQSTVAVIKLDFQAYQNDGVEPIMFIDGLCGGTGNQYSVGNNSGISIDDFQFTERAFPDCAEREQFGAFLTLLGDVESWSIQGDTLMLSTPDGRIVVATHGSR